MERLVIDDKELDLGLGAHPVASVPVEPEDEEHDQQAADDAYAERLIEEAECSSQR
jgi:hypothetical protein